MQRHTRRPHVTRPPEGANVTSAIGMQETFGSLRIRRNTLFARTVIWVTGLICMALLLGSLAQAWSNSQLMQRVQEAQQQLQSVQRQHATLERQAAYYSDPKVIESEARQQLNYVRPGEHLVLIVGANNEAQRQRATKHNTTGDRGFWQEWWDSLFG